MPGKTGSDQRAGLLILGNQLFPPSVLADWQNLPVFMAEDQALCTYVSHHQQKLVLVLAAMREYADALDNRAHRVTYHRLPDEHEEDSCYEARLAAFVESHSLTRLVHFEIEGHRFARRIEKFCENHGVQQEIIDSPMFLTSRAQFADYLERADRPHMADFYKLQRRRMEILLDSDKAGKPAGGKWSHDASNRKKLPKGIDLPSLPEAAVTDHTRDVIDLVRDRFANHPGQADEFWWPVTRRSALYWLNDFVSERLAQFGPYQDAISQRSETAFHSVLSPMLNIGLITPRDVIDKVLAHAAKQDIPINSLEGLIRQVIGWREFIRGIYHHFDTKQRETNFWNHQRVPTDDWYTGTTGIPPLDHAIKQALKLGWSNHISRLMVVGNMMTLAEIQPGQAYKWFMETHADASGWVMGPNVYGMALFSDGGIFATKPYICGSNYLLKMSDYSKGDWCDVVDGLYWRFIDQHKDFFAANHRTSMMVSNLSRLKPDRRSTIFSAADQFLAKKTTNR